jgi:DNA recombination protein RmuC
MEYGILIAVISAAVSAAMVWLYQRSIRAATAEKLRFAQSQIEEMRTILRGSEVEKDELNLRLQEQIKQVAVLDEKLKVISDLKENLRDNFKTLSAEALQQSNQSFLQLATENLAKFHEGAKAEFEKREKAVDTLVEPIKKTLEQFDIKLNDLEKNRAGAYSALTEQVKMLGEAQSLLRQETQKLATSLSTSSKVRGRWGEVQLRRVVELTGMLEHCDFDLQSSFTSKEDDEYRPDMVIRLPGNRTIMVDAKAPIQAYLESLEASDETSRQVKLDEHAAQLKRQIMNLGTKAYHKKVENSVGFVVLFVPGDVFFHAAMERAPDLNDIAIDKGILLASPTSLVALLWSANRGWQQEKMIENAYEISKQGAELYRRTGIFMEKFQSLERAIRSTVKTFNETQGSLESRFIPAAREMRSLLGKDGDSELPTISQIDIETRVVTPLRIEVEVEDKPELS